MRLEYPAVPTQRGEVLPFYGPIDIHCQYSDEINSSSEILSSDYYRKGVHQYRHHHAARMWHQLKFLALQPDPIR